MIKHFSKFFIAPVLLVVLVLTASAFTCIASNKEYKLADINLIATLPDDMIVITRESTSSDPAYKHIDTDPMAFTADMEQKNMYLYAFNENNTFDFTITAIKISGYEYSDLSESELNEFIKSEKNKLSESDGIVVNSIDLYKHNDTPLIIYDLLNTSDNNNQIYVLEATVAMDGLKYSILFQSYGQDFTEEQRALYNDIINNLDFTEVAGSSINNRIFKETIEMLIGFGITIAILGLIIFTMNISKKNKKKHVF